MQGMGLPFTPKGLGGEESQARAGCMKVGLGAGHLLPPPQSSHCVPLSLRGAHAQSEGKCNQQQLPGISPAGGSTGNHSQPPASSLQPPTFPSPGTFLWFSTWHIKEWDGSLVTGEAGAQLHEEPNQETLGSYTHSFRGKSSTYF